MRVYDGVSGAVYYSDAMTGYGAEHECDESNNSAIALVEAGDSSPDLAVTTDTTEYNCSTSLLRVGLSIENQGSSPAESFDVSFYAGEPAQGGTFLQQETFSETLEPGASINPVVKITKTQADNATIWAIVNPQQSLQECNYANNIDPADGFTERCDLMIR